MFVFISALSPGRRCNLVEPVLDVCLCLEEQHYSVMYIFVNFYIFFFLFRKEEIPYIKKPA